ncbi:uncharacterized protein LOC143025761 [Oratosquilla oratoria]|uniref:uncharacterized protein LOC143025761 n=1 Tax=Oratosquilla oratoria TaxID=337810 RepID=UPI003F76E5C1
MWEAGLRHLPPTLIYHMRRLLFCNPFIITIIVIPDKSCGDGDGPIATWNIRTLLDSDVNPRPRRRTALVAHELSRYNIDIAALSETRLSGEDSLSEEGEGYTFFWKGLPEEDCVKEEFYNSLNECLQAIHRTDRVLLMGDFNARVGRDHDIWPGVLGKHGVGKANDNEYRLLTLSSEHQLHITNTNFQLKTKHKNTWKHPRSGHWHQLDHIIRQSERKEVLITKTMRGADCWTDHRLVRCKIRLEIRPQQRSAPPTKKLNIASLGDPEVCAQFRCNVAESLMQHDQRLDLGTKWTRLHSDLYNCAVDTLRFKRKHHQDWFDQNSSRIHQLLEEKKKAHDAHLNNPQSSALKNRFTNIRAEVQRELRQMENEWWQARATELQQYADSNNSHGFYNAVKAFYGPKRHSNHPVRAADGTTLLKSNEQITSRWAEHFNTLLNQVNPIIPTIFDSLPNLPTMVSLNKIHQKWKKS